MYLQLLNYVSYFFSLLFLAFLYWSLNWKQVKQIWKNAKTDVLIKKKAKEIAKELAPKAKKRFSFEWGSIIIWDIKYREALYDYKQLKKETKQVRNQLKKA